METFSKQFVASRPAAGGESCGAGFYFYFRQADNIKRRKKFGM